MRRIREGAESRVELGWGREGSVAGGADGARMLGGDKSGGPWCRQERLAALDFHRLCAYPLIVPIRREQEPAAHLRFFFFFFGRTNQINYKLRK